MPNSGSGSKPCGRSHIPANHECHAGNGSPGTGGGTGGVELKSLPRNKDGSVRYRGEDWHVNKPKPSSRKHKKMKVLAKKGDRVKVVHFGDNRYEDYLSHNDPKRRKNYLSRASGIKNKQGEPTKDDPWSPNYWSIRKLWPTRKARQDDAPSFAFIEGIRSIRH